MHPTFTGLGPEYPRPANTGSPRTEPANPSQKELSTTPLKPGEIASAQVVKATPASDATRQRLITLYTEATGSSGPSDKLTQPPQRLQSLLQSPSLVLVELKLQGKLQLALTSNLFKTGQTVEVRQSASGALQILNTAPQDGTSARIAQGRLSQALKTALPQHAQGESISGQLSKLQALQQLLQAQPNGMNSALNKTLLQSLKQILQQPASAEQLSHPKQLKQQLNTAGPAMESQLKGLPLQPAKPTGAQPNSQSSSAFDKLPLTAPQASPLKNSLLNSRLLSSFKDAQAATAKPLTAPLSGRDPFTSTLASKAPLANDLKALLLTSLQLSQPSLSPAPTSLKNSELDQALAKLLAPLLQSNSAQHAVPQGMTQLSAEKLLILLQHQLQKILGRVQLQQLQALNKQLQSAESGAPLQHLQLELPIRHGTELYNLAIHIDEEIHYQEKKNDEEKEPRDSEREQVRQWQVKLAFDLPQGGRLHAHLSIINESVSASLWAESPQLLSQARGHLTELRERMVNDGLEVKALDCFAGSPPLAAIELRYNLVDIKT